MHTVQTILETHGINPAQPGFYHVKVNNSSQTAPLTIEGIGKGPHGRSAVSVCRYRQLNGDVVRDPEMCFEIIEGRGELFWRPFYYRNDWADLEQESTWVDEDGQVKTRPTVLTEMIGFAKVWDRDLREQGFLGGR